DEIGRATDDENPLRLAPAGALSDRRRALFELIAILHAPFGRARARIGEHYKQCRTRYDYRLDHRSSVRLRGRSGKDALERKWRRSRIVDHMLANPWLVS